MPITLLHEKTLDIPLTFVPIKCLLGSTGFLVWLFLCPCLSKCVHSLIKLSLPSGVSEVEAHVLEEVWDYYEEALSIIAAAVSQHQSHTAIPRLPPPVPSKRTSLCYVINPLSSTPCLPACCSRSLFLSMGFQPHFNEQMLPFTTPFLPIWILMCCTSHHTAGELQLWKRHQIIETLHCFRGSAYFPFHIELWLESGGVLWIKVKAPRLKCCEKRMKLQKC